MNRITEKGSEIILVGLVGSIGSGKITVSNFLHYSHGFVKINFTDVVKEVAQILGKGDRRSLQAIRHAMREGLGEDVWIRLMEKKIEEALASRLIRFYSIPGVSEVKPVLRVVVGDIGYRNEFDFVKGRNGLLIGFRASEETLYERIRKREEAPSFEEFKRWLEHPSEMEIPSLVEECDFVIDTDSISLPEIEERVDEIVRRRFM